MNVRKKSVGDEFRECDNCGYRRGFHSSFNRVSGKHNVVLICPECGTCYDVGWKIKLEDV